MSNDSHAPSHSEDWPDPRYAWYVVALLVLAYASGIVDRIIIGLLVDPIKQDLGLTDTQIGIVQGFAFAVFYSLFTLPVGLLIDRWRRVPVLWVGIAIWSLATVAAGFARTFWSLFTARVLVGAGEATTMPGSSSVISDYFPPHSRPRAFGVFLMGGSVGIGVAYLFGAIAIQFAGGLRSTYPGLLGNFSEWQIVLFVVGAPGLILALLMALTIKEPRRRGVVEQTQKLSLRPLWKELKTNRVALLAIMFGSIMNVMIVNAMLSWFPTLFIRVHGWEAATVGQALALVGVPIGLLSALTAGWALSKLARRGRTDGPILLIAIQCAAWVVFGTFKCFAPSPYWALAGHVATAVFATWAITSTLTALNQITPNQLRGQVVAIYTLFIGLVGVGVGAVAVGLLSDHVFTGPRGIAPSLALVCAVSGIVGILVLLAGRRSYQRAVVRAREWEAT